MKKKLFIANDSSFLASGYGVYGKELLTRLNNSGKYEIAELGCYGEVNDPRTKNIPWKFYPNAVNGSDPRIEQYKQSGFNQFGAWRFDRAILDFKPHIVFDVRDYWMYSYQEASPFRKYFNWVLMPTVDSAPQRIEWLYTFASADLIVPYTDWAKSTLSKECGDKINLFPKIANAGIDPKQFYPLDDKKNHQKSVFGHDASVVGLVMRNQKRKLFADILRAYRIYLNTLLETNNQELYNKSYLYLHTSYPEEQGWDFPALLLEYDLLDKVYFTYVCRNCKKWFPSKFQNSIIRCKNCQNVSASFANVVNSVGPEELNKIYNLFDFFIQYAICEGFGMPQIEAASCGVPFASVDYSAMTEIAEKLGGFKIPLSRVFREMETNADRVYPDINETVIILYNYFVNSDENYKKSLGLSIREKCSNIYTWDNCFKIWDEAFDTIDITKKEPWDSINIHPTYQDTVKVPDNLNPAQFVEFVCKNILNEDNLHKTAYIQNIIREVTSAVVAKNNMVQNINFEHAIQSLNMYLQNKIYAEQMRINRDKINKEDFLLL